MKRTVCISGGFDPLHVGHMRMIREASQLAADGKLIVILNSDEWLTRKKSYVFMTFDERREILMGVRGVTGVSSVDDSDGTVCEALRRLTPDVFANGGDRKAGNVPEDGVCNDLHIEMIYNVGGGKVQSSSKLAGRDERSEWNHE